MKILYANANGLRGKIKSLENAAKTMSAQIICITETKGNPPTIPGYSAWHTGGRMNGGGGVAITIREDLSNNAQPIDNIEDNDQEIVWIRINGAHNSKISIGVYYGKQETEQIDIVEREFSQLMTQIIQLKKEGPVILTGDFNAKIRIIKEQITQNESRNGTLLSKLIEELELTPISTKAENGTWTWEKRTNNHQKSIIDYILISKDLVELVEDNIVDSEGILRLKGKKETDHNTLFLKLRTPIRKGSEIITKWKKGNDLQWNEFNKEIQKANNEIKENYDEFEEYLIKTLKNKIGETRIRIHDKNKSKPSNETKEKKEKRKILRKEYQKAIKDQKDDIESKKREYIQAQVDYKNSVEKDTQEDIENKIQRIIKDGGTKSNLFWKTKREILKKEGTANYNTLDEKGTLIEDPEAAKEHIANFYENLYHARGSRPGYEDSTREISDIVKEIENSTSMKEPPKPININELEDVIQSLKKGKATGPDNIPNEIFIKADKNTIKIYAEVLENINKTKSIPPQWQKGKIIRIYKGKGTRGKCSNERGITKSSNFGKVYERIINNRILEKVNISEDQAGGKKG